MRTPRKTRPATDEAFHERVNRAIDYVVRHLAEPMRLNDVARAAHLSPFHFHRVFQVFAGETLTDFIKRLRIERTLTLMSRGRKSNFTEIALTSGFASSSDFSRCFKQRFGVPPSAFDIASWQAAHRAAIELTVPQTAEHLHVRDLPNTANPDGFRVRVRPLPKRTFAYVRVQRPYRGDAVLRATQRLVAWAERHGFADNPWYGYQWDNPEVTALDDCLYFAAVEAEPFAPKGEIGRVTFPPMQVAELELHGGLDLELRAIQWLYAGWLPTSGYVPDDHPSFEAWNGRPFAHGAEYFELKVQVPVCRG